MKLLLKFFYLITLSGIAALVTLLLLSLFPFQNWYQVKVVLSGSMEPSIPVGSIIVIKPQDVYKPGDVITFGADTIDNTPVTHRIVEQNESREFVTKGDANPEIDQQTTTESSVIGRVLFQVPYIGFLLTFAKTSTGFWTLVITPAILIAIIELATIVRAFRAGRQKTDATFTDTL